MVMDTRGKGSSFSSTTLPVTVAPFFCANAGRARRRNRDMVIRRKWNFMRVG